MNIEGDYYEKAHFASSKSQEFFYVSREEYFVEFMGLKGTEKILDIGCGSGTFSRMLARKYPQAQITGVDVSKKVIEFAEKQTASEDIRNLDFAVGPIEQLPVADNAYDAVNGVHLIEHLVNPDGALVEVNKKIKPGGLLYITTPNYLSLWPLAEYMFDRHMAKDGYKLADQHISKFDFWSIQKSCKNTGFKVEKTRAVYLFSLPLSLFSKSLGRAFFKLDCALSFLPIGMIIYLKAQKTVSG